MLDYGTPAVHFVSKPEVQEPFKLRQDRFRLGNVHSGDYRAIFNGERITSLSAYTDLQHVHGIHEIDSVKIAALYAAWVIDATNFPFSAPLLERLLGQAYPKNRGQPRNRAITLAFHSLCRTLALECCGRSKKVMRVMLAADRRARKEDRTCGRCSSFTGLRRACSRRTLAGLTADDSRLHRDTLLLRDRRSEPLVLFDFGTHRTASLKQGAVLHHQKRRGQVAQDLGGGKNLDPFGR